jgi:hypothetical protein
MFRIPTPESKYAELCDLVIRLRQAQHGYERTRSRHYYELKLKLEGQIDELMHPIVVAQAAALESA